MNTYPIGNALTLTVTFTVAATGVPADPHVVKLRIMDPAETETDITQGSLTHPTVGTFQYSLTPEIPGVWKYRFEGTDGVTAAAEKRFEIQPSSFEVD